MTGRARKPRRTPKRRATRAPAPARVLIVDDHPLIRHGLTELLSNEPGIVVCGEAGSAGAAWEALHDKRPDLLIVDLSLQEGDGLELVKAIHARYPAVRLLVVSMHDEKVYAERALRAGASGYVQKHEPPEVLVAALRQVLAGSVYLSRVMAERLLRQMVDPRSQAAGSPLARLSDRELQILDLLGRGLGTPEIARQLHLSAKTVQSHREHLKAKLSIQSGAELLYYAIARQFASGVEPPRGLPPEGKKPNLRVTK